MDDPAVLQTGPETFQVLLPGGRRFDATLAHHTRRGLGLHGVPPLAVTTEIVRFLLERDALPDDGLGRTPVPLATLAGRFPEFTEELRHRLT